MVNANIKETLEKQLQLLYKCSANAVDGQELAIITEAMVKIAALVVEVQERRGIGEVVIDRSGICKAIYDRLQEF